MQLNVQRRLNRGLQMGLAYTLAKGEGWTGYNPDILEADPDGRAEPVCVLGADGQQPDAQPGAELQLHDPERDAGHADAQVDARATGRSRASRSS